MAKMTSGPNIPERLLAYWRAQPGLQLGPPAAAGALGNFEREHGIELPLSVREYLSRANGFKAPGDQDQVGFSFWPVEKITPLSTYQGGRFGLVKDVYLFADYLGWSWGYGMRLAAGFSSAVYIIGTADNRIVEVARSFDEFADLYISDNEKLYVP